MKVNLAVLHFALIFYCVYFFGKKWNVGSYKLFWGAFLVRLMAGTGLGLVYTYYYSAGDTWSFFNDAKIFSSLTHDDFFSYLKSVFDFSENQSMINVLVNHDSRSIFFIKIISFFCWLSLDNYWVCTAYFSLLSFISAWTLHCKVVSIFPDSHGGSAFAFLFFPSVIFWSSGLEKESIALCGIYFLVVGFLTLMSSGRPDKLFWWLLIPVSYVVWGLKYYWAIILLDSMMTSLLIKFLNSKFTIVKKYWIAAWILLFFGIGVALSFVHPNFCLDKFLEVIISNNNNFAAISNPKNLIHYFQLDQTWTSIIINSPWALVSGLFRPVIGEGHGLLGGFASIENLFVLILFVGALFNLKGALHSSHQIILLATVSYCIVLCIFLALSTPNFGTLSRYRVGFLSFYVFVIAYRNPIIDWLFKTGMKRL